MDNQEEESSEMKSSVERGVSLVDNDHAAAPESSTAGESAASSYAAELVQSAARSLLDTSTTLLSDDEDDNGGKPSPSAALASLQTEKIPALPDEQDRKRFIVRESCLQSSVFLKRIPHIFCCLLAL